MRKLTIIGAAVAALMCTIPVSFQWSHQNGLSVTGGSAIARIGRPLTPMSVAGVHRRVHRRAYYGAPVYHPYRYHHYRY
jgi:hypothetical protein